MEKIKEQNLNKDILYTKILKLNENYAKEKHITFSDYTQRMLKKCKKNNCYLFLKKILQKIFLFKIYLFNKWI